MAPNANTTTSIIKETALALQRSLEPAEDPTIFSDFQFLYTNRANKLKRGAEDVEEGHLSGRRPYKKKIIHAGYTRSIIHTNPRRYDLEGYELASSDEDSDADADAAQRDPYIGVDVLGQLMPLARPFDLEHHPALSLPYKSKVLDDMVATTSTMLHNERRKLVEIKNLMTTLRGDYNWIPCGQISEDLDRKLANGLPNGASNRQKSSQRIFEADIRPEDIDRIRIVEGRIRIETDQDAQEPNVLPVKAEASEPDVAQTVQTIHYQTAWPLPDPPSLPPLPAAEESKRLLTAIVQKQTEIVQGVSQLYNSLLRAKRLKETVWRWCRAEGHLDEMSDGEDWVDLEEWGLTQMLTKGTQEGLGIGNGGDDPEYLARRAEAGAGGGRGRRRGAQ